MKKLILLVSISVFVGSLSAQWQTNGPYGGNISAIAIRGPYIFVGTDAAGMFLSTDNGGNWTSINTGLPINNPVLAIAICGSKIFVSDNYGLYLSTDNGTHWTQVDIMSGSVYVTALTVIDSTIFAADSYSGGIFISHDSGSNWTLTNTDLFQYLTLGPFLVKNSNQPGGKPIIFLNTDADGVFLSTDNGSTWLAIDSGLPANPWSWITSSLILTDTGLYLSILDSGVFLSTNNGTSWGPVYWDFPPENINLFVINGSHIFAGTDSGTFLSSDYGSNWMTVNLPQNIIVSQLVLGDSNTPGGQKPIFAGTIYDAGILVSFDSGENWTAANNGLADMSITSLATTPNKTSGSGANLFASTSHGVFLSTDNGNNWQEADSGLEAPYGIIYSLIANDSDIYANTSAGIFLSTNNGQNWAQVNLGLPPNTPSAVLIAHDSSIFASAGDSLYLSLDNGHSWTAVNNNKILPLAFMGTRVFGRQGNDGLYVSADTGGSWSGVNQDLPADESVNSLVVSGSNLFISVYSAGVFVSYDYGANWWSVYNGLTSKYVNTLFAYDSSIFAGTDTGVFLTTNNGVSWISLNDSFTTDNPQSMSRVQAITVSDSIIFAGTDGVSVWQRCLQLPPSPVINTDTTALTIDSGHVTTLIATGIGTLTWYSSESGGVALGSGTSFVTPVLSNTTTFYVQTNESCGASARTPITVIVTSPTGILANNVDANIKIFPNPSTSTFNFANLPNQCTIEIYNVLGQQVYSAPAVNSTYQLNMSSQAKGIYFYRVIANASVVQGGKMVLE